MNNVCGLFWQCLRVACSAVCSTWWRRTSPRRVWALCCRSWRSRVWWAASTPADDVHELPLVLMMWLSFTSWLVSVSAGAGEHGEGPRLSLLALCQSDGQLKRYDLMMARRQCKTSRSLKYFKCLWFHRATRRLENVVYTSTFYLPREARAVEEQWVSGDTVKLTWTFLKG